MQIKFLAPQLLKQVNAIRYKVTRNIFPFFFFFFLQLFKPIKIRFDCFSKPLKYGHFIPPLLRVVTVTVFTKQPGSCGSVQTLRASDKHTWVRSKAFYPLNQPLRSQNSQMCSDLQHVLPREPLPHRSSARNAGRFIESVGVNHSKTVTSKVMKRLFNVGDGAWQRVLGLEWQTTSKITVFYLLPSMHFVPEVKHEERFQRRVMIPFNI